MNSILGQDVPLRVWPEKLAPGALFLESVRGSEALSELFQYELHLLGLLPAINYFEALLGQAIRIELNFPNGGRRTIHGLVGRLSQLPLVDPSANQVYGRFRALVVPRFWLSTKNQRNRVFQRQSVRQILGEVLKGLDVEYALTQSYPTRNFCVQYQESDFHFASRLMEEEGISYFFRHRDDGHQLVLSDDTSLADDLPAPNPIRFDATQGGERDQPRVSSGPRARSSCPRPCVSAIRTSSCRSATTWKRRKTSSIPSRSARSSTCSARRPGPTWRSTISPAITPSTTTTSIPRGPPPTSRRPTRSSRKTSGWPGWAWSGSPGWACISTAAATPCTCGRAWPSS